MTSKHLALVLGAALAAAGCAHGNSIDDDGSSGGSGGVGDAGPGAGPGSGTGSTSQSGSQTSASSGCGDMCDGDGDGVLDGVDQCMGTPTGEPVNMLGCSASQLMPKLEDTFPPYGLTWTPTGDPGRAGGMTWTYTGIDRGDLFHIYWVLCDDPATPCGVSLDGPIDPLTEKWTFDGADSNLPGGTLVLTNTTHITLADGTSPAVTGRLTVTSVDANGAPIPFGDMATLGITPRDGQFGVEVPGIGYTITMLIEVQDSMGAWVPYLDYYDDASTPDPGSPGTSISIGGSFYDD
jgi:hypothetical protein